jgi:chromosome segregation ATPase
VDLIVSKDDPRLKPYNDPDGNFWCVREEVLVESLRATLTRLSWLEAQFEWTKGQWRDVSVALTDAESRLSNQSAAIAILTDEVVRLRKELDGAKVESAAQQSAIGHLRDLLPDVGDDGVVQRIAELDRLRAEIERLGAEFRTYRETAEEISAAYMKASSENTVLQLRLALVERIANKYGWHLKDCDKMNCRGDCSCGYEADYAVYNAAKGGDRG